jgi:hypothetical protein
MAYQYIGPILLVLTLRLSLLSWWRHGFYVNLLLNLGGADYFDQWSGVGKEAIDI